jgi:hypothetical protein
VAGLRPPGTSSRAPGSGTRGRANTYATARGSGSMSTRPELEDAVKVSSVYNHAAHPRLGQQLQQLRLRRLRDGVYIQLVDLLKRNEDTFRPDWGIQANPVRPRLARTRSDQPLLRRPQPDLGGRQRTSSRLGRGGRRHGRLQPEQRSVTPTKPSTINQACPEPQSRATATASSSTTT